MSPAGMYEDTTFLDLIREDPTSGPFATYDEALDEWSARSRATIDVATVRFWIVEADEPTDGQGPTTGSSGAA